MRKFVSTFVAAGTGLVVLGALSCSSDSPSPLCTASTSGDVSHRIVTDGASTLDIDLSTTSTTMRLLVDGALALEVVATSTPQGWSETATQGPAYSGQQQHVIHLLRSDDVMTGDVDGKPLAPFSKDADASTVHFADGTPFTAGIAPASQHVVSTYQHLSEAFSAGACLDESSGSSTLSIPATPTPNLDVSCAFCVAGCVATATSIVVTGVGACLSVFDGVLFGIPAAICSGIAALAGVTFELVCTFGCESIGGACCPIPCNSANDGSKCCGNGFQCSDPATNKCCPDSTTVCNQNCCSPDTETCTSFASSTCCPNGPRVCGDGTACCDDASQCLGPSGPNPSGVCCPTTSPVACNGTCCPEGQTMCVGSACCAPADVCNTLSGQVCCSGGSVCTPGPNGGNTCACPPDAVTCGAVCCVAQDGDICAPNDGACCKINIEFPGPPPIFNHLCGGHCCDTPCTTFGDGTQGCCPAGCAVGGSGGTCCGSGQACVGGICQ